MSIRRAIGRDTPTSGSASRGAVRSAPLALALALGWTSAAAGQTLSIAGVTLAEGNTDGGAGSTDFVFALTLSTAAAGDVEVAYDVLPSGGPFPVEPAFDLDLGAVTDTLPIPAGKTTATITVPVVADLDFESTEFFVVELRDPKNATLDPGASVATGVIVNDDLYVTLTNAEVVEGDVGTTDALFELALAGCATPPCVPDFDVEVDAAATESDPVSATVGFDFESAVESVVFPIDGPTTHVITVDVHGDLFVEPSEIFFLELLEVRGATGTGFTGIGTILNDDAPPPVVVPTGGWGPAALATLLCSLGAGAAGRRP